MVESDACGLLNHDVCGLTGGGGGLWLGLADCVARASDTRVCLAGRSLQLRKAPVEAVEISDDHLPCCQAIGESNLSKNLSQNRIGETPNVYIFECGIVKAGSACEHLKSSRIVLCHSAGCHSELMKLCTSCPCPIWVS